MTSSLKSRRPHHRKWTSKHPRHQPNCRASISRRLSGGDASHQNAGNPTLQPTITSNKPICAVCPGKSPRTQSVTKPSAGLLWVDCAHTKRTCPAPRAQDTLERPNVQNNEKRQKVPLCAPHGFTRFGSQTALTWIRTSLFQFAQAKYSSLAAMH